MMRLETQPATTTSEAPETGLLRLSVCVMIIGVVWLLILPGLSQQPHIDAHLKWLDERGIDPSAMYYTDLEAMEPILERMNKNVRKQ